MTGSPFSLILQVAETCQLAVRRLEWLQSGGETQEVDGATDKNPYCSVDPAPPAARKSVSELRTILLDESLQLFERYRAMFALRNLGSEEAVLALGDGRESLCSLSICARIMWATVWCVTTIMKKTVEHKHFLVF